MNTRPIPPCRSSPISSIESAPATIPATSEDTFPPAFAPLSVGTLSCCQANLARPAASASASTGTSPAADTRFRLVQHHRDRPNPVRELHSTDALRAWRSGTIDKSQSPSRKGIHSLRRAHTAKPIGGSRLSGHPRRRSECAGGPPAAPRRWSARRPRSCWGSSCLLMSHSARQETCGVSALRLVDLRLVRRRGTRRYRLGGSAVGRRAQPLLKIRPEAEKGRVRDPAPSIAPLMPQASWRDKLE